MIFILSICFLLLSYSSCTESIPKEITKEDLIASLKKQSYPKFGNVDSKPHKNNILRPFNCTLEGLLGDEEPIEMYLYYNPQTLNEKNPCIKIKGDYQLYTNESSSQKLEGNLCFDTGIITLYAKKFNQTKESFKGIIKGQFHFMSGKWSCKQPPEHTRFHLKNTSQNIDKNSLALFSIKLNEHFKNQEEFSDTKVGFDERGIYIEGIKGKKLNIKYFSHTKLQWSNWEFTTSKDSDFSESIELWFYNNDSKFVIIINTINWKEKKQDNGSIEESEYFHTEVWQYDGNKFHNIFLEDPKKQNLANTEWYANTRNNVIQLHNTRTEDLWEKEY